MATERKSIMISVRLPTALAGRLDYAVRNTDAEGVVNRSTAVCAAVGAWLETQEHRMAQLGIIPKKASR
jgi:metal-responsive CopG/Arc/MetJ family transcriptional regulator